MPSKVSTCACARSSKPEVTFPVTKPLPSSSSWRYATSPKPGPNLLIIGPRPPANLPLTLANVSLRRDHPKSKRTTNKNPDPNTNWRIGSGATNRLKSHQLEGGQPMGKVATSPHHSPKEKRPA